LHKDFEEVYELFPILKKRIRQTGGTLSGGEQQMLAIARGMMGKPLVLLLDEPSMGLAPVLVEEVFKILRRINQRGTSILLVEQNAKMALSTAKTGYILEHGEISLSDTTDKLIGNKKVKEAYLGII
jgi:branched-chain amino acid transport system ATP-binding protein